MKTYVNRTFIRLPIEEVIIQLERQLAEDGFRYTEIPAFNQPGNGVDAKRKLILMSVHSSQLHGEMMSLSPVEGIVLPCLISVIQTYPGETALVLCNPTAFIIRNMQASALKNLTEEVTQRLERLIGNLKRMLDHDPDLVTSWG